VANEYRGAVAVRDNISCSSSRATDQVSRVSHLTLSARSGLTKAFFSQHGRRTATAAPDRTGRLVIRRRIPTPRLAPQCQTRPPGRLSPAKAPTFGRSASQHESLPAGLTLRLGNTPRSAHDTPYVDVAVAPHSTWDGVSSGLRADARRPPGRTTDLALSLSRYHWIITLKQNKSNTSYCG
jgi:hypothetical protein